MISKSTYSNDLAKTTRHITSYELQYPELEVKYYEMINSYGYTRLSNESNDIIDKYNDISDEYNDISNRQ